VGNSRGNSGCVDLSGRNFSRDLRAVVLLQRWQGDLC
jgi:hypothetical protein